MERKECHEVRTINGGPDGDMVARGNKEMRPSRKANREEFGVVSHGRYLFHFAKAILAIFRERETCNY